MKNLLFAIVVAGTLLGVQGCGGGGENQVITEVPDNEPEMSAEEAAAYERELQKSMQ